MRRNRNKYDSQTSNLAIYHLTLKHFIQRYPLRIQIHTPRFTLCLTCYVHLNKPYKETSKYFISYFSKSIKDFETTNLHQFFLVFE